MENCSCSETVKSAWGTETRDGAILCVFCGELAERVNGILSNSEDDINNDEVYEYKYSLNKSIREGGVPLYATFEVPGREISESLGMISGVGNAMFTLTGTSALITNRATAKSLKNLFAEAERIEADGVVGVNLALDSFAKGWVQQLAVFTGTAMNLKSGVQC